MVLTKQILSNLAKAYDETDINEKINMYMFILEMNKDNEEFTAEIKEHIHNHTKEIQDSLNEEEDESMDTFYYYEMGSKYNIGECYNPKQIITKSGRIVKKPQK